MRKWRKGNKKEKQKNGRNNSRKRKRKKEITEKKNLTAIFTLQLLISLNQIDTMGFGYIWHNSYSSNTEALSGLCSLSVIMPSPPVYKHTLPAESFPVKKMFMVRLGD